MYYLPKFIKKIGLHSFKDSTKHPSVRICAHSEILNSKIERYSYIGYNTILYNVEIGSFCSIASDCRIGQSGHPIHWISTSPTFNKNRNILKINFSENQFIEDKKIIIGNDVWIGNNVHIKSGVKISDGAIIGMGSVVTKNVGPYEIWGGNPAKLIKKRFSDETINKLLSIKWWNWSESLLVMYGKYFDEPENFLSIFEKNNIGEKYEN